MIKNTICSFCGKTIQNDYVFCPWCGKNQAEAELRDYLEVAAEKGRKLRDEQREQKLKEMEKQLEKLEQELNVLVMCREMPR